MSSHQPSTAKTPSGGQDPLNSQEAFGLESSDPNMHTYSNILPSWSQGARKNGSSSKSKQDSDDSPRTDPKERRREQNRLAQRRFREKLKKQNINRDSRNVEDAGSSYQVPEADNMGLMGSDVAPLSLPWDGLNISSIFVRGYDDTRGGGRVGASADAHQWSGSTMETYTFGSDPQYLSPKGPGISSYAYTESGSWKGTEDNAGGDESLYESTLCYHDHQGSSGC
ncbi:hypothetical protein OOU_Y34scaffold00311g9 [Pyricularia oryzae Y34]|uniref:BZIP domain-containing protein n=2 Tax=Pyricularia TaxID=48558 RepID=A0A6P8BKH1_PYRGI|nr:uncharacterized protein PgNI_01091 [Pyricularia grisea]ELQ40983.1 hypothetical protein OOU_Y34scaffold00311g9 [Pyricularia oryzae Y34]TLD17077.1 hypothetical protein PgNI_01091 [Pyricularia grisea]